MVLTKEKQLIISSSGGPPSYSVVRYTNAADPFTFNCSGGSTYVKGATASVPLSGMQGTASFVLQDDAGASNTSVVYQGDTTDGQHWYMATLQVVLNITPSSNKRYSAAIDVQGLVLGLAIEADVAIVEGCTTMQIDSGTDTVQLVVRKSVALSNSYVISSVVASTEAAVLSVRGYSLDFVRIADF